VLLMLAVGAHLGRGVAFLVGGVGWVFPDMGDLFIGLPGVLSGDPSAGLDHVPAYEPAVWVLWTSITSIELAMVLVAAAPARAGWRRWGPGRLPGTASRSEAASLLGVQRLRRSAPVIRPDLYRWQRR